MQTIESVMSAHKVEIPAHLEEQAEIPLLTGLQRQGDVFLVPMKAGQVSGLKPVPAEGIPLVRGENGGNTHLLVAEGDVQFAASQGQDIGTIVVAEGSAAYVLHPEHGAAGIAPGHYIGRRQREQAEEIRLVAD